MLLQIQSDVGKGSCKVGVYVVRDLMSWCFISSCLVKKKYNIFQFVKLHIRLANMRKIGLVQKCTRKASPNFFYIFVKFVQYIPSKNRFLRVQKGEQSDPENCCSTMQRGDPILTSKNQLCGAKTWSRNG
jgi:hypothetical protein